MGTVDDNHSTSANASPSLAARVTRGLARRHASETNPSLPDTTAEVLLRTRLRMRVCTISYCPAAMTAPTTTARAAAPTGNLGLGPYI